MTEDEESLNFSGLDEQIDEWIALDDTDDKKSLDGYYYGGSIHVYRCDENDNIFDVLFAMRDRDPYDKTLILGVIELGDEILNIEKEFYLDFLLKEK